MRKRQQRAGLLGTLLGGLLIVAGEGAPTMAEGVGAGAPSTAWAKHDRIRAFYSGHSLSDGVPEVVAQIARSLGHHLDFEVQVLGYSLLRQRTKGEVPGSTDWPGYRSGHNRRGAGLDVAAELRKPQRLGAEDKYDALVVTERHDLPSIARTERTAFYLSEMAKHLLAGNPDAEVLFYHAWLHIDPDAPLPWIDYERAVSKMWECLASRANLDLPRRGNAPRIRVLPGGSALVELVAELWEGKVPGVTAAAPGDRVRLVFSDTVHMSEIGRYYMALVHYAVLFGRSPEGALAQTAIRPETSRYMQALAWRYAVSYGKYADAAASRDMAECRRIMQEEVCPASATFQQRSRLPLVGALQRRLDTRACQRAYTDARDPENPFGSSDR